VLDVVSMISGQWERGMQNVHSFKGRETSTLKLQLARAYFRRGS
jgi:hypothetical protein